MDRIVTIKFEDMGVIKVSLNHCDLNVLAECIIDNEIHKPGDIKSIELKTDYDTKAKEVK